MRLFILIITVISVYDISSCALLTPEKINQIKAGQTAMLNGRWAEAYNIFENYHIEEMSDPAGYLFRAAVLQSEMTDREENLYTSSLRQLCDSTKEMAQRILDSCDRRDSALCYLYIGHQYAYRSIYESRFGSSFSALRMGFKAKGQYQKGLRVDSTLYDLYLGIGSYHYWKSVKSGILKWAGIFKNEEKRGIDEIGLAADSSLFSREASLSAMIWIMINEKEYNSALALSLSLSQKYPRGNSLLWPTGESYYYLEQYKKAAETYETLFNRLKENPGNYYNLIEAVYWLKRSCNKSGENAKVESAIRYLNSIYKEIPRKTKRRQKTKLSHLLGRRH